MSVGNEETPDSDIEDGGAGEEEEVLNETQEEKFQRLKIRWREAKRHVAKQNRSINAMPQVPQWEGVIGKWEVVIGRWRMGRGEWAVDGGGDERDPPAIPSPPTVPSTPHRPPPSSD